VKKDRDTTDGERWDCDDGKRRDVKGAKSPTDAIKGPADRHDCGIALSPINAPINTLITVSPSLIWLQCCTFLQQLPTMVVLVDLDDDEPPSYENNAHTAGLINVKPLHHSLAEDVQSVPVSDERPNPNINGFSAALSCYP
jgi:hypothetical protein